IGCDLRGGDGIRGDLGGRYGVGRQVVRVDRVGGDLLGGDRPIDDHLTTLTTLDEGGSELYRIGALIIVRKPQAGEEGSLRNYRCFGYFPKLGVRNIP